jgi:hypothetical protein
MLQKGGSSQARPKETRRVVASQVVVAARARESVAAWWLAVHPFRGSLVDCEQCLARVLVAVLFLPQTWCAPADHPKRRHSAAT